jgi:hypothetical protein
MGAFGSARRPVVICLVVALVLPDWPASHRWVGLFSLAPLTSFRVWIDGIVFSVVFGWISAVQTAHKARSQVGVVAIDRSE